uniref:Ribosomal protein S11 n=1 Tax=Trebouxia aggregata TaxID=160068 RepID=G8XP77_9CHLO|nr:ribosomal protein S11 [Trebouxia aggregata]
MIQKRNPHSVLSKKNPEILRTFHTKKNLFTLPFVICSLKNNMLCVPTLPLSHQDYGHPIKSGNTIIVTPCKNFTTGASVTINGGSAVKKRMQSALASQKGHEVLKSSILKEASKNQRIEKKTLYNNFTLRKEIPSAINMQKNELDAGSASTPKKQDYKQKIFLKRKRLIKIFDFKRKAQKGYDVCAPRQTSLAQQKNKRDLSIPRETSLARKGTNKIYKGKRKIKGRLGKLYISSTKNNTILTLIDINGNTKGWGCSGSLGFKNARKSTTYAAQAAAESLVKKAKILGYTHLRLLVKGLGRGKQSCLRALSKSGLKIISLEDQTGIPYNGCRASKKRRV